jgi:hypothetical protein
MEPAKTKKPTLSKAVRGKPIRSAQSDALMRDVPEALHAKIDARAREIYEARIRQGALDDWLQAEREILKKSRAKPKGQ